MRSYLLDGMGGSQWRAYAGSLFWGQSDNEYVARAAVCEQRAKDARTESENQSWLVMAESWRETVKLQEMLTRHAEFIR
jgi:hypothetical protein